MEEWYSMVRQLKDESDTPNEVEQACHSIFRGIANRKIKEMKKFEQRMGPEYEQFVEELKISEDIKTELLRDDEFFKLTLELQKKYRR
jgi:16S rRNA A1518/A1519 N6-dimethyltransferase RsmA/KsgA/DIM1 with predicted DNA glycosylase/AP lyase activity